MRATFQFAAPLFALILFLLSGCTPANVVPVPDVDLKVAVDLRDPVLQLPVYVAVHERMFAAQRLRVSVAEFPDGPKTTEAVVTGACQLAVSGFDQVLAAGAKGQNLTSIAVLSRSPMLSIVAGLRPKKRRGMPDDLESIAVVNGGDPTDVFARYVSKLETEPQGSMAKVVAAFEQRSTGAAVLDAGTLQMMDVRNVPYTLLVDTRTLAGIIRTFGVSTYPATCVYANTAWISAHKGQLQRVGRALVSALEYIRKHEPGELVKMLPEAHRSSTLIEQARPLYSPDGVMPPDAADAVRRVLAASKPEFSKATVPPTAYSNDFVNAKR